MGTRCYHDLYARITSSTDSDLDSSNHVESTEVAMDIDMNSESSNCISTSEYTNDVSNSCPVTKVVSTEVVMDVDKSYESESHISNSEPNSDSVDSASHASSDPNSMNDLETVKRNLETYATDNNFTICDVPGDGNCLYNSILYQLESKGVISTTVENLRQVVALYLEEHANIYMPFVVSPIASDNPYNNDTETPDAMDAFISDPETSSVLAYERYIERVRSDSWGDHVVISALANMFHVTINVVHARQRDCTISITPPVDSRSNCELNLGLVMQYHFVVLDKQEIVVPHDNENPNIINHYNEQTTPTDQFVSNNLSNNQSTSNLYNLDPEQISVSHGTEISVRVYSFDQQSNANDQLTSQSNFDASELPPISSSNVDTNDQTTTPLDDTAIEEGDEHTRQIIGGPLASIMSIENPETFNEIVCVAPAEGQRPLSIMTDSNFETMSNPEKFPISDGCFAAERPRKLTYRK